MDQENTINNPSQNQTETQINKTIPFKGTIILIILLALVTAFFIYLAIMPSKRNPATNIVSIPTPTPYAQSVLSLNLDSFATNSARTINVSIDSGNNKVTAVQIELSFDPKVVKNITIEKGNFLSNAFELLNNINYQDGRLTYALGIPLKTPPISGKGVVAKINYDLSPTATVSSTTFSILPKSLVTTVGIIQSTLKSFSGITVPVSLQPNTATQSSQ